MIRSAGRLGPVKAAGLVAWQLRYDLLTVLVVAAIMVPIPDAIQSESVAVLSVLGIAASIFIGFRNSNAYNRWWEARTLGRHHHQLPGAAQHAVLGRHRRARNVFHPRPDAPAPGSLRLAAGRRDAGIAPLPGVAELTPEDGPDADATELLALQARDVQTLYADGYIDEQARVMLMSVNTGTVTAQSGLERIRNQPVPIQYDLFIRGSGVAVRDRGVQPARLVQPPPRRHRGGVLLMAVFVVAERIGHFIELPMRNSIFDLPMYRFCSLITGNLLGAGHPLARRASPTAPRCGCDGASVIRSVGRAGPLKVCGLVLYLLRYDLLAVLVVAAVMALLSDRIQFSAAATLVPLLGWSSRSSSASATAPPTTGGGRPAPSGVRSSPTAGAEQRAHRARRHLRGDRADAGPDAPQAGPARLATRRGTARGARAARGGGADPEDPPQTSATRLLNLQAADTRDLVLVDLIDRQGRVILTNLNTAQAAAVGALERIANQAIPFTTRSSSARWPGSSASWCAPGWTPPGTTACWGSWWAC